MTIADLQQYFEFLAAHVPDSNRAGFVSKAIKFGLAEFWNARAWSFRSYETTIDTSTAAEDYDLPDDFGGVITVRQKDSLSGGSLRYVIKEEFDELVPKPTAHQEYYPQAYTIYKDGTKWKIKFFPVPSIDTVYIQILSSVPAINKVPDKFIGGIHAVISKYIYPPGSEARFESIRQAEYELNRLENEDSPFDAHIFRLVDDTDMRIEVSTPWI